MLNIDMRKIYNFYPIEPTPDPAALPTGGRSVLRMSRLLGDRQFRSAYQGGLRLRQS